MPTQTFSAGGTPNDGHKRKKKPQPKPAPTVQTDIKPGGYEATSGGKTLRFSEKPSKEFRTSAGKIVKERVATTERRIITDAAVTAAFNERANNLHLGLVESNPSLAVELLTSPHPTATLRETSQALFEAHQYIDARTAMDGAPGAMRQWYENAATIADPQARHLALVTLDHIKDLPEEQRATTIALLQSGELEVDNERAAELLSFLTGETIHQDDGFFGALTEGLGKVISIPFAVPAKAFELLLGDPHNAFSEAINSVGAAGMYGIRTVTGTAGFALAELTGNAEKVKDGEANSLWEQFRSYVPSWSEFNEGGHSGLTKAIFELDGTPIDGDTEGLASFIDLATDIYGGEFAAGLFREFKAHRTSTQLGGGFPADDWVETFHGKRTVNKLWKDIERLPEESRISTLVDRYRHLDTELAADLAGAVSRDDMVRRLVKHLDETPQRLIHKTYRERAAVRKQLKTASEVAAVEVTTPDIMRTQSDIGKMGVHVDDADYVYTLHRAENVPSIARGGLDPKFAKRGSYGVHFAEVDYIGNAYKYADDATAQGAGGTEFVIMRVPKEVVDLKIVEPGRDLYTENIVPPTDIQVLSGGEFKPLTSGAVESPVNIEALRAQDAALTEQLALLNRREIHFNFPSKSQVQTFMRAGFAGKGLSTRFARTLNYFFGEGGKLDLSKFTDDLSPRDMVVYNPTVTEKPYNWATHNAETLRKVFNIAKVDKAVQRGILEEMVGLRTPDEFFQWRKNIAAVLEDKWTNGGKRALRDYQEEALRFSKAANTLEAVRSPIEVVHTLPDGTTVREFRNVTQYQDGTPFPSMPTQDAGHLPLGDIDLIRQASSWTKRVDLWLKDKPYVGKAYGKLRLPYDAYKVSLEWSRSVLKPLVLQRGAPVVGAIPMISKIQMDQGLRNFLMGMRPLDIWSRVQTRFGKGVDYGVSAIPIHPGIRDLLPKDRYGNPDLTAMGTLAQEAYAQGVKDFSIIPTKNLDPLARTRNEARVVSDVLDSRFETIASLRVDPLAQMVAARGPEATLEYLANHTESRLGYWYEHDQVPRLQNAGITPEQWLADVDLQIEQAAGGIPGLRDAIATGKWHTDASVPTALAEELVNLNHELGLVREASERSLGMRERNELNVRAEMIEDRIKRVQRETRSSKPVIDITKRNAVTGELKNRWADGTYEMPESVRAERTLKAREVGGAEAYVRHTSEVIYRGFRPWARADEALTRGSTYRQVLNETFGQLVDNGMPRRDAFEVAQQRAAYITKDLHYDLSARSSFDRATKDIFWFAPVVREQLFTYLYRIPSKSYWPIGMLARTGEARALLQNLRGMGLLRSHTIYNPDTGEEEQETVAHLPWISDFLGKLYNNEDVGDFRIGSLNPITPGGEKYIPTLSPAVEAVLDFSANHMPKELRPWFDFMAQNLEFDESADEFGYGGIVPSGIRYALERLGMHLPFDSLSVNDLREANRKAEVQALRWAMHDLAKDGILPPKVPKGISPYTVQHELAPSKPVDKHALEQYYDDVEKWKVMLQQRANHYKNTLNVTHLIGTLLLPSTITTTSLSKDGERFYEARERWIAAHPGYTTKGSSADNPENDLFAWADEYAAAHPTAWPYMFGTHDYEKPKGEPFDLEDYRLSPTLDPRDYVEKALTSYGYIQGAVHPGQPDPDETGKPEDYDALDERQKAVRQATYAQKPVYDLNTAQLHALGIEDFQGKNHLLDTLKQIDKHFENIDLTTKTYDQRAAIYADHQRYLERATSHYGEDGKRILRMVEYGATPATRLADTGYWHSKTAKSVLSRVDNIWRRLVSENLSPQGTSELSINLKAELFRDIDRLRRQDPVFDREVRRAEMAMSYKTGQLAVTSAYNQLWFGAPEDKATESYIYQEGH